MNLNRQSAPDIRDRFSLEAVTYTLDYTDSGIPVYFIEGGDTGVLRISFHFHAGQIAGPLSAMPSYTNAMLTEGTASLSSAQIAEQADSLGAFIEHSCSKESASFTLYCIVSKLADSLSLWLHCLQQAAFLETELNILRENRIQKFRVNCEKVDFLVKNNFGDVFFGSDHPLNERATEEKLTSVRASELIEFHRTAYLHGGLNVIVAGNAGDEGRSEVLKQLKALSVWKSQNQASYPDFHPKAGAAAVIRKSGAMQSAIRMGTKTIHRSDAAYPALSMMNTLFGGYFGSRLMSNIREDKGFTYGIGSSLQFFKTGGALILGTEVGKEVTWPAIKEIFFEMERLRNEPVEEEELNTARNYLAGNLLRGHDGPFAQAERLETLLEFGLPEDYYVKILDRLYAVTPSEVKESAARFLNPENFVQLIAGDPE